MPTGAAAFPARYGKGTRAPALGTSSGKSPFARAFQARHYSFWPEIASTAATSAWRTPNQTAARTGQAGLCCDGVYAGAAALPARTVVVTGAIATTTRKCLAAGSLAAEASTVVVDRADHVLQRGAKAALIAPCATAVVAAK